MPTCSECEAQVEGDDVNPHLPQSGLVLDAYSMGYYGGLFDLFPPRDEDEPQLAEWKLCEACARKLFDTFPNLKRKLEAYVCYVSDTRGWTL
jgi:hypothetical protein